MSLVDNDELYGVVHIPCQNCQTPALLFFPESKKQNTPLCALIFFLFVNSVHFFSSFISNTLKQNEMVILGKAFVDPVAHISNLIFTLGICMMLGGCLFDFVVNEKVLFTR
jgi:hypothetical protein